MAVVDEAVEDSVDVDVGTGLEIGVKMGLVFVCKGNGKGPGFISISPHLSKTRLAVKVTISSEYCDTSTFSKVLGELKLELGLKLGLWLSPALLKDLKDFPMLTVLFKYKRIRVGMFQKFFPFLALFTLT